MSTKSQKHCDLYPTGCFPFFETTTHRHLHHYTRINYTRITQLIRRLFPDKKTESFDNGKWVTDVYVLTKAEVIQLLVEQKDYSQSIVKQLIDGVPVSQIKF